MQVYSRIGKFTVKTHSVNTLLGFRVTEQLPSVSFYEKAYARLVFLDLDLNSTSSNFLFLELSSAK